MMTDQSIQSDLAIPPGEFLEEVIAELGMTKNELARRMNRPAAKLSAIFNGEKSITPDTALQLGKVVGVPAYIWTGLEAEYRLTLARQQQMAEQKRLKDEQHLITKFCYKELANLGYLEKKARTTKKVLELQRFFGVTSLKLISNLRRYEAAFRVGRNNQRKRSPEATVAWLRLGEIKAQKMYCAPFTQVALNEALPVIRLLSRESPTIFENKLSDILCKCGVALVLVPHLPKTYAHGATFWLGKDKAVIMVTIRGSWNDIFWFSLFHEIGHILLHNKQVVFIESEDVKSSFEKQEQEADRFAANTLIPKDKYIKFTKSASFYKKNILDFAESNSIHPGIVVGRLQHDGYIEPSWHNGLRDRFTWGK